MASEARSERLAEAAENLLLRPNHPVRMLRQRAEQEAQGLGELEDYLTKAAEAIGPMPAGAQGVLSQLFWQSRGPR